IAGNTSDPVVVPANIDNAAPVSSITFAGASSPGSNGKVYVSSVTSFLISTQDSTSSVVVSGIGSLQGTDEGVPFMADGASEALGAFGLEEGTHSITYAAQDLAGNVETLHTQPLFVDLTPPVVSYSASPAIFFNGFHYYATPQAVLTLSAVD